MKHDGSKLVASYSPSERKPIRITPSDCPIVSAVHVRMAGTNAAGVTRTSANNGYVEISYKLGGKRIPGGKWPLEKFAVLNADTGGYVTASSAIAAAFDFLYEIPFNNPENDNPNAIHLSGTDEIELWFDDMKTPADFTTATLSVIAVPGDEPMEYLQYFGYDEYTMGSKINEEIAAEHVDMLMLQLSGGATDPDNIGILKRGQVFDDLKSEWDYLTGRTNARYQLESAPGTEHVLINFSRTNPQGFVGATHLNLDGGAGTIYWYAIGRIPVSQARVMQSAKVVAVRSAALSTMIVQSRTA